MECSTTVGRWEGKAQGRQASGAKRARGQQERKKPEENVVQPQTRIRPLKKKKIIIIINNNNNNGGRHFHV
jgi:hypothetical protein